MGFGNKTISGSLLFVAAIVYLLGTVIGEKFGNMTVYSAAILLLGLLMLVSVYFIQLAFKAPLFSGSIALAAIGTIAISLLTYASTEYYVFAAIGYIFFGLSAIMSYKYEKTPLSYISVILGIGSLIALLLWAANVDLGSGMKVTPIIIDMLVLLWLTGFGAHILGENQ